MFPCLEHIGETSGEKFSAPECDQFPSPSLPPSPSHFFFPSLTQPKEVKNLNEREREREISNSMDSLSLSSFNQLIFFLFICDCFYNFYCLHVFLPSPGNLPGHEQEKNRINKDGELVISSTKTRTQKSTSASSFFVVCFAYRLPRHLVYFTFLFQG